MKPSPIYQKTFKLFDRTFYHKITRFKTFSHLKGLNSDPWWNFICPVTLSHKFEWDKAETIIKKEKDCGIPVSYYIHKMILLDYKEILQQKGYKELGDDIYVSLNLKKAFKDTDIQLEEVTKETLDDFIQVTEKCFPEWDEKTYCKQVFEISQNPVKDFVNKNFLVKKNNEFIAFGSILISKSLNISYLHNMGTVQKHRRKGYFTKLTKYFCNFAMKHKVQEIFAMVESNSNSYKGFEKLGFKEKDKFFVFQKKSARYN